MPAAQRRSLVPVAAAPAVVVAVVWAVLAATGGPGVVDDAQILPPAPAVAAAARPVGVPPDAPASVVLEPSPAWVATVAAGTGIPARALTAYAAAQLRVQAEQPSCRIGWTTLAAIGSVESDHGRHGGSAVDADGVDRPTVTGPPLDGTAGNKAVPDTDGGSLDGDPTWDRAVGPMQFIPQTWQQWGRSAHGSTPDPADVDDAALTAATYLCAGGADMATPAGWRAAIASYNEPVEYAVAVADRANAYAARSRT